MRAALFLTALCTSGLLWAQPTIGLTQFNESNTDGYVLFSGISSTETYLVDKCGKQVNEWSSDYRPGLSVNLLPNGNLFRTGLLNSSSFGSGGGKGGMLEMYDWNGNLLWSYAISDNGQCQHHDAMVLPNGHILAIVWELKTSTEAELAGKNPSVTALLNNQEVWSEKLVELEPVGTNGANIVWEWKAWDHLVQDFDNSKDNFAAVDQHPELLNVNYVAQGPPTNSDWLHINSVDYDPIKDQLLVSSHSFSEFWIIDHSTTTAQAAGHSGGNSGKGGDLLYRWGNPTAYDRGSSADQKLYKQHHATFIEPGYPNEGKVLVFNNGVNRPGGNYTSIDMVDISEAGEPFAIGANTPFLPTATFWTYSAPIPSSFYATNIGGVFPLSNGSFLITDGPKGELVEIDANANVSWRYVNPVSTTGPMTQGSTPSANTVFRAVFYPVNYEAFDGLDMTPGTEIEIDPTVPSLCVLASGPVEIDQKTLSIYPNPITGSGTLSMEHVMSENYWAELFNAAGQKVASNKISADTQKPTLEIPYLKPGIYFLICTGDTQIFRSKLVVH